MSQSTDAASSNGSEEAVSLEALQKQVTLLAWLHAEQAGQVQRLAMTIAALLAQAAQPTMQQQILNGLLGVQPPAQQQPPGGMKLPQMG